MRIDKTPEIQEYISYINDINDLNLSLSEMFLAIINNDEIASKKEIEVFSKTYEMEEREVFISKILDYWGIDVGQEEEEDIVRKFIYPAIKEINLEEFLNNPYYKTVKIQNIKDGRFSLVIDHYRPYEIFALDDISVDEEYHELSKLGYFKSEFPFIALNENDVTWMSITPNEIKTMEKSINEAFGNVIVFGLGLGYFPFMVSLKETVKHITIIEKDEKIISLFSKYLLPQFPNKDKISIQKNDAFEVIKHPLDYDYAFVDLWHSPEDGIDAFLTFKNIEKENKNCDFSYWLDNAFYAYLRRAFIVLLEEQLSHTDESSYKNAKNDWDKLINKLYFNTKNLEINSVEQIKNLLSNDNLIKMAI